MKVEYTKTNENDVEAGDLLFNGCDWYMIIKIDEQFVSVQLSNNDKEWESQDGIVTSGKYTVANDLRESDDIHIKHNQYRIVIDK